MAKKKVLITGMSGLIGGIVRARLEGNYILSALNRRPVAGIECHQADIADLNAIQSAFDGVDVVVHLAANAQGGATWEDLLSPNIIGTYNQYLYKILYAVYSAICSLLPLPPFSSSSSIFGAWR